MTLSAGRRPGAWAVAAVPLAGIVLLAVPHPPLTRHTGFAVRAPADGSATARQAVVRWSAAPGAARYAVVVDAAPPAPGATATASAHVVLVDGRQVALSLGDATKGSPSSRGFHTLLVVPLDSGDRRLGEDVAVVHLRSHR